MLKRACAGIVIALVIHSNAPLAYQLLGPAWENAQANIYVNIEGASSSGPSWNSAFSGSVSNWNTAAPGFQFDSIPQHSHPCAGYAFPDDSIPFPEDFRQGVDFYPSDCGIPFDENTLAVTIYTYDIDTQHFADSDIIFNSNIDWDVYAGQLKFKDIDFRRVAKHELGHFSGLGHTISGLALMHPTIGSIENPTADDIAGVRALYPGQSTEDLLIVSLEEPIDASIHGGIGNLRGWAVAEHGIDRVEIFIDGKYMFDAPFGGTRTDVGSQFPEITGSDESGFSLAYGYSNLSAGPHTITARAYNPMGAFEESIASFTVVTFHKAFIPTTDLVDIEGADIASDGDEIFIENIIIDGQSYDLQLKWRTAEQGFEIIEIR